MVQNLPITLIRAQEQRSNLQYILLRRIYRRIQIWLQICPIPFGKRVAAWNARYGSLGKSRAHSQNACDQGNTG